MNCYIKIFALKVQRRKGLNLSFFKPLGLCVEYSNFSNYAIIRSLKAVIIISSLLLSCTNHPRDLEDKNKGNERNEKLVKVNKFLVDKDVDIIKGYIKRRNWDMNVTQTGLWYMIYEKGKGKQAKTGKKATLSFKLSLLDGTLCYSSDKDGLKTFTIGKGGVEAGLEEGTLLMKEGDKARFIMMPHLAHGLIGDEKCIPARAIILYEVELLKISE